MDGDTVRLKDLALRLWGIDAPELAQQGWGPGGVAVPVGQQSRNSLADLLNGQAVTAGPASGVSYGRPVVPITIGNSDLAQQLLREGQGYAAPDFLGDDPERRFDYLQAERLARQNRLGVHDYLVQPPAEHRANPDYVPERETVAMFFDTPTPFAGMRPEAEARYVELLNTSSSVDEIVDFVASQAGFKLDPGAVAKWIEERDTARASGADVQGWANYAERGPMPLTDTGTGATGAGIRGFGSGFLASGLDEGGAFFDMLGGTPGRESVWNSDRRLADIWFNNQQQNASILGYDEFAHPIASTVGEVGGAITSGFVIPYGQGARTVPQLARVGAVYGGAEGFLGTDGGLIDRAQGAAIGTPIGAAVNAVGGKALEAVAPFAVRAFNRATGREAPRAAGVAGDAPEGYGEGEALEAAQGAVQGQRGVDRLDIPPGAPGAVTGMPEPVPTGYPGPAGDRERNWIDINSLPPPPPGFKLDHPPANDVGDTASNFQELVAMARRARPEEIGMDAEPMPSISGEVRQRDYIDVGGGGAARAQRLDQPLTEAQMAAAAERIEPRDVVPIPSNEVASVEEAAAAQAGRVVPAKAPNERGALTSRTVRNWQGREVPKVGPIDLVGWVRLRGGINDSGDALSRGGDLKAMGLSNAPRRGLDFAGQEARMGPVIREGGMTLDDAAEAAWEAGYFPELSERPSINEFLQALDDTNRGGANRRFLPEDGPELDEYYGRQAARHDLEQEQDAAGGPVYVDRSVPADENAPFAPPEAFVDWPADAVTRAGNIRLDKLDSPQDIRRALVQTNNRVGFDAATRGRVTNAETERLASELNMTPDDLLARRKGQALNAEEALAARQILAKSGNELVNAAKRVQALEDPGDELLADFRHKWMRHVAIQEQVAGMTAEAGRALQQFTMAANSRAVRGHVLNALVRGGGGKHNLIEAAETLIEAAEVSPGVFNAVTKKATKAGWQRKVGEFYINFLLSNPATHVVNMTSNTLTAMAQIPEHLTAAAFGGARQAFSRSAVDRVTASEVGQRAFGLMQGAKEGARLFARAVRTGEASDHVSKVEGDEFKAIQGIKGEVIRIPTRLLTAEDELFKGMARRMELNGLAARQAHTEGLKGDAAKRRIAELSVNPTDAMLHQSLEYGLYLTFQKKLGPFAQNISNASQNNIVAKLYLPFVRTPTNLLKFAAERSPLAPLLKEWRADFRAGGARRDLAAARALLGTGFGLVIYQAALNGHITGAIPSDPKKARLLRAEGWQEYSFKIGDDYYSYKRLDPFAMTLGVAADMATLPEGMSEREKDDKAALVVASILGNLASKTWLSGISDFVGGLDDPARNSGNMIERLVGSFAVPAGVAGVSRALDPTARKVEGVQEAVMARVPGLRDDLLPQRDIWGEEVTYDSGFLSPAYTSQAKNDPVNLELLKVGYAPGYPSKTVGGRELTREEHDRYVDDAGQLSHERLTALVTGQGWLTLPRDDREKLASQTVSAARKEVRERLFGGGDEDPPQGSQSSGVPPPPPGFTVEGEAAGRNVYRELQEKIPGLTADRITSGFRDYDYNQSLKARGYHPADNSTHMDGDTLDLTPPSGKSFGWLRAQVKRHFPEATDFLVHDGHLHARFPGYYGAPVLGGAQAAGVRNPYAGMPPPPSGFTLDAGR